ncbi:hypothetical protein B9G99_06370 [Kushneria konosiri]|uniref:Guanylate cyclase domain-containing protein n=2 Tax=Kushneria konosiri TaxID=698828 RepID=A0A2Z2HAH3_9GAMM|nr:hypothetical protein B9G99_06370 [Kushneria konosiri]
MDESIGASLPDRQYRINEEIRRIFNHGAREDLEIGGHPDFDHLAESRSHEYGYVVSLFMDVAGSTKLGITYPPDIVFNIKNNIIRCAIETIQAFGGHVHRIMGDAVLAFFRNENTEIADSCINSLNCGTYLIKFVEELVIPELQRKGVNEDVGIRVGMDYGPSEQVLWGMYGYRNVSEITATSYYVDIAAKLQHSAPKNKIMIGQSFKEHLDLHDDLIYIKTEGSDKIPDKYVTPNYKRPDDSKMNYKKFVLNSDKYYELLPSPSEEEGNLKIQATPKKENTAVEAQHFYSCARAFKKDPNGLSRLGAEFKATFRLPAMSGPYRVKFRVENHGEDAALDDPDNFGNHEVFEDAKIRNDGTYFCSHWEHTSYVGLHYMIVSVWDKEEKNKIIGEKKFGVYVT